MGNYIQDAPLVSDDVEVKGTISSETAAFLMLFICGLLALVPGLFH